MRYLTVFSIGALGILLAQTGDARAEAAMRKVSRQFFIENRGQWHPDVLYLYRGGGMDAWITRDGVVYDFYRYREVAVRPPLALPEHEVRHGKFDEVPKVRYGHVVRLRHVGGNRSPQPVGQDRQPGYYNYFLGSDPSRWVVEVPLYGEVEVREVYPGIHQRWYVDRGRLRYDYVVMPGADASQIELRVEGADWVRAEGDKLMLGTRFGAVEQAGLYVYQGRERISAQWVVEGSEVGIAVGSYDRTQPLVIDPLVWSDYFVMDRALHPNRVLAVDGSGAVYVAGGTESSDFPTTPGSYDQTYNGSYDVFITKLDPSGSRLVWSTFLGGSGWDEARSLAVDESGAVYVTGWTWSSDFPTTPGSYDQTDNGSHDVFITKLDPSSSRLVWSTFLGGRENDEAYSLAVDANGAVYVTGYTSSSDFPTTPGSYDQTHGGGNCFGNSCSDAFITKLDPSGSRLVWSTFLGGSDYDFARSLAVDGSGAVYVTGNTFSKDFPTTAGSYDQTHNGEREVFITKLDPSGSRLIWSTFLGGSDDDFARSLAVDGRGAVYVTGYTESSNFPTTAGSYDQTHNGERDAFITKLDPSGSRLVWSTFLGGSDRDIASSLAVDETGAVYVTGGTYSSDFPTTAGSYDQTHKGGRCSEKKAWIDVFITKLDPSGSRLVWSTFLGGSYTDIAYSLVVDGRGAVCVTGWTESPDFPTTPGSYDQTYREYSNIFISKVNPSGSRLVWSTFLGRE